MVDAKQHMYIAYIRALIRDGIVTVRKCKPSKYLSLFVATPQHVTMPNTNSTVLIAPTVPMIIYKTYKKPKPVITSIVENEMPYDKV